ncbi:hypothetical protein SRRS_35870 [Sporomusa rhizae]
MRLQDIAQAGDLKIVDEKSIAFEGMEFLCVTAEKECFDDSLSNVIEIFLSRFDGTKCRRV